MKKWIVPAIVLVCAGQAHAQTSATKFVQTYVYGADANIYAVTLDLDGFTGSSFTKAFSYGDSGGGLVVTYNSGNMCSRFRPDKFTSWNSVCDNVGPVTATWSGGNSGLANGHFVAFIAREATSLPDIEDPNGVVTAYQGPGSCPPGTIEECYMTWVQEWGYTCSGSWWGGGENFCHWYRRTVQTTLCECNDPITGPPECSPANPAPLECPPEDLTEFF